MKPISASTARWLLVVLVGAAVLTVWIARAGANPSVTRGGLEYNGIRNPGGCEIMADKGALHVKCTEAVGATGSAFIRYRFLSDVGAERRRAVVTAFIDQFVGQGCHVEWMVREPHTAARTARVTVPKGNYCHINSVTWSQR